ncbi:MAG TPA: DNA polymerase III subunit gamma and tau [Actinomycetes bacterium]|nr:DNA polymerase III subunit gamma and tau [Actinomycetes bacterium]
MSTALYRRYRPERFADLIGQEHVTEPLMQALAHDRVTHAYLFSGPRGCGKTTSARILARCLNCEKGPTPEPCGECQSCRDLSRGGPGSIDVIEIDAASHGGVDDARELRDRAFFAPASSRYKIYIIDEAHMVSTQGFNALLKVVEEPPEHVKFVFATTEPEKVIGTIRSRTHHYPFRLVPSRILEDYLASVCESEGVSVEPGVLASVVRAGAGSVRDSLSVLDQLIGGAEGRELTYERTIQLLGFTPAALLDDIVDAVADANGTALFAVIDSVIDAGLDPERFMKDLLERFRDLVMVAAVEDAFERRLVGGSDDQRSRLQSQADRIGLASLTRCTELVATGIADMKGPTPPRLHLELVCAKLLLPGAHSDELSLAARLDRIERRMAIAGAPDASTEPQAATPTQKREKREKRGDSEKPDEPAKRDRPVTPATPASPATDSDPVSDPVPEPQPEAPDKPAPVAAEGGLELQELRRMWPAVLNRVKDYRKVTWAQLFEKSDVLTIDDKQLHIGLRDVGSHRAFSQGGHDEIVRQAMIDVVGLDVTVVAVLDPTVSKVSSPVADDKTDTGEASPTAGDTTPPPAAAEARAAAAAVGGPVMGKSRSVSAVDEEVHVDDPDADDQGLSGPELIAQQLGGTVIGEIEHT